MNFDNPTPTQEKEPRPLSLEEIKVQIERLSKQEKLEVVRTREDGEGIYLYEAVIKDEKGDSSLYSYRRSGNYPETKAATTVIDVAYFVGPILAGEMCIGGDTLSNYDETTGKWTDAQ